MEWENLGEKGPTTELLWRSGDAVVMGSGVVT
jgi:hypothetical protein